MDKSFCDVKTACEKIPELKKYIPDDACGVGISKAGNLKYENQYEQVQIVQKALLPFGMMNKLRTILSMPVTKNDTVERPKISAVDYKKFDFDVSCPNVVELFIREHDLSYYRLTKKSKKLMESPLIGKNNQTETVIRDLVLKYVKNEIDIDVLNVQMKRNCNLINDNNTDIIYNFYEKSAHLANVSIEFEKPCVYFKVTASLLSYRAEKMFRLDQKITKQQITEWLDEKARRIIEKKNNDTISSFEEYYVRQFENALRNKFSDNGYAIQLSSFPHKSKMNYKCSIECKRDDVTLSLNFTNTYPFEKDFLEEEYNKLGLLNVTLSKTGRERMAKETNVLYKRLCERNWKINVNGKLSNEINYLVAVCNKVCDPLLNGESGLEDVEYSYDFGKHILYCENSFFKAVRKDEHLTVKYKDYYKKLQHEKNLKRYQQACEYIKDCLAKQSISLAYINGRGTLYGETNVIWHCGDVGANYVWKSSSYKDSLVEWKKQVEENIEDIIKVINTKQLEKEREFRKRCGALAYSFIAYDIAVFVKRNENYITENATIHYLRGLSNTFGGNITETDAGGRYKPISSDEVEDIIDRMIAKDLFRTVTLKGTYGKFDILKSTTALDELIRFKHKTKSEKELLSLSSYSDYDAQDLYTVLTAKEELEVPDYMQLLKLIPAKGFICRNYTDFVETFKTSPDAVKTYLKMKKEMTEDNYEKKLINQMLKK